MNRKILIQVTGPAVVIGLLLFGACLISIWQMNRLQSNMTQILAENVASLRAAQQMEINLRRLRFHCFLYLIDPPNDLVLPGPAAGLVGVLGSSQGQGQLLSLCALVPRRNSEFSDRIHADHERFEHWLAIAWQSSRHEEDRKAIADIQAGYHRYRREFDRLSAQATREGPFRDFHQLSDAHPVQYVVDPCQELLRTNESQMEQTMREADSVSRRVQILMYLLGFGGPLSGIIIGYGVARGLSRSIYQLSVRVQNMAQRLDQDVASVSVAADGDIQQLDTQLQRIVSQVEEVAERLQRQQRDMLRAEQLSAVGQLAASVAHEVRNPLAGIKLLVEAALRPRNPMPLTAEDLEVIHREIARVEQTVQGLLNFARLPTPARIVTDLRTVVVQVVDLIKSRARQQQVELVVRIPEDPLLGDVDPNLMGTVFVNLLLNALDAMPGGGTLDVALDQGADGSLRCVVSDSGSGISPEMFERLFVPFSSSKPTGTGLGLSICRRIVEDHGGQINGVNRPEGGACFTVTLASAASPPLALTGA